MAKVFELDEIEWRKWVAQRPTVVRNLCKRFPPNRLYRLRNTGQRVTISAYREDGTLRVEVSGQYNLTPFNTEVFGVTPDDMQECELPASDEPVGAMLTDPADIERYVDAIRPLVLAARGIEQKKH